MTRTPDTDLDPPRFVVRFRSPDGEPCEIGWALADDKRCWYRQPSETSDAFELRVLAAEPVAICLVFFPPDDDQQEDHARDRQDSHRTLRVAYSA